jgi:hypothetical protein
LLVAASPRGILLLLVGPMATTALLTAPPTRLLLLLTRISTAALLIALASTLLMLAALALLHGKPPGGRTPANRSPYSRTAVICRIFGSSPGAYSCSRLSAAARLPSCTIAFDLIELAGEDGPTAVRPPAASP